MLLSLMSTFKQDIIICQRTLTAVSIPCHHSTTNSKIIMINKRGSGEKEMKAGKEEVWERLTMITEMMHAHTFTVYNKTEFSM